ncbi:MAG: hypothetical protein U0168_00045 [Nannocystaceae bacterium]|jgi:hypothetical protein
MLPTPAVFVLQLAWFTVVFAVLARRVVWPWSARLSPHHRAALWIAPQMSRALGLGLMVPHLAPGMPEAMAVPTAIGDSLTATLALAAFVALHGGHRLGPLLGWVCMIVGIVDGVHALSTAARLQVATNLAGQWYVPAVNVPLMAVCHVAGVVALRRMPRDRGGAAGL